MTLSFLAPWALALSVLLAVPLAVHIFKPRRVRRTPFSSLRWLKLSPQKLSRRLQWHQVLLFMLRSALVLLLVFALARPILVPAGAGRPVDRFVVVDTSRSMALEPAGRSTPMDQARTLAAELIRRQGLSDRTAVLLAGQSVTALSPLSRDPETALPSLAGVLPTSADANLSAALAHIQPQLGRREADSEIIFMTTNSAGGWRPAAIGEFAHEHTSVTRVRVVDVGVPGVANAWIVGASVREQGSPPQRIIRVDLACTGDAGQERSLRLTGLTSTGEQSQAVVLDPGQPGWVEFTLPPGLDVAGQIAHLRLEPADALPDDDEFWLPLDAPAAPRVLVVEADSSPIATQRPGFPLLTALDVLASDRLAIRVTRRTDRDVTPRDFDEADLLVLADPADLSSACLEAAERRVRAGAGLAIFLGPQTTDALAVKLMNPLRPNESLLPIVPQLPGSVRPGLLQPLTDLRASHPLFAGLTDPVMGDLAQVRVRAFATLAGPITAPDDVIARVDGGVPAVIDRPLGAGRVVLFTTGADDSWSDLPRRRCFLPLVDRLVNYLAAGGLRRDFVAGQPLTVALPDWQPNEQVTIRTPDDRILTPETRPLPHGRGLMRLAAVEQPGIYLVERSSGNIPLAVNAGRGDSHLTSADTETLRPWWGEVAFERLPAEEFAGTLTRSSSHAAGWPWLVLLAAIILAIETHLAYRLCPQANPSLARPLVSRTPTA